MRKVRKAKSHVEISICKSRQAQEDRREADSIQLLKFITVKGRDGTNGSHHLQGGLILKTISLRLERVRLESRRF